MDPVTFEGKTQMPVYPTSALIRYNVGVITEDAASTWYDMDRGGGDLALTPNANLEQEVLNDAPVKIISDNTNKNVNLWPGVWKCEVHVEGLCTTSAVEPRVAVVDSTASGTPTVYMVCDMTNALFVTGHKADVYLNGLISIQSPTDIRLVLADGETTTSVWTTTMVTMNLRRISDYVSV